ncbi:MAG: phenylpyruvate tautomerase MIF-related protein [Promethearchaeota archaeon]|jgi:phenylpyruvate tautomerase PptA (4-oxalocrotonate tautomerase family)
MPYLKIQTNQDVEDGKKLEILEKASKLVASGLGKPESYMMVVLESLTKMIFAGVSEPTIFMELKSIGLPETKTADLSKILCDFTEEVFGVNRERTYIVFTDINGSMWGWNGRTF